MLRRTLAGALVMLLAACGGQEEAAETEREPSEPGAETIAAERSGEPDMADLIAEQPRFSVLRDVLDAADLITTFENQGPLTLFAPSNEAFAKLPPGYSVEVLSAPENRELLRRILAYHVVAGRIEASDIVGTAGDRETIGGDPLPFDGTGTVVTIGTAPGQAVVLQPDLRAANGVIHVIDSVLLPPA